ncbi:hypothetical protein F2Q68_00031068 [Brassica cretica]|uniref:Uncharacterized protein n=1 Tax=Brassica cretica TaxID=69181 RepID=A0A8S9GIR2_BRACR|nr:hypothetical protein F2Q68_00031068 [Brassica cretica]
MHRPSRPFGELDRASRPTRPFDELDRTCSPTRPLSELDQSACLHPVLVAPPLWIRSNMLLFHLDRSHRAREREALPDHPEESSEAGSMERAQKARRMPTLRSKSQAQSPGIMARPVSIAVPAASSNSPSSGLPPPLRASGEGTSRVDPSAHLPEASSWGFSYDNEVPILKNPERLALIWRKIRERGCELPSLGNMREREAYVRMAVANAKAMEARNEYAALMEKQLAEFPSKEEVGSHLLTIQQLQGALEAVRVTEQQRGVEIEGLKGKLSAAETERVAVQNDLDLMKEKHWREIKGLDVAARKERDFSHRSLAREYNAVLAVVKDKLQKKKKETAAETRLQEVRARIETLTEYIEGGFELEEELEHLRGHEISLDLDYGLASVSDPSLSRLELPDISGFGTETDQESVLCAFIWSDGIINWALTEYSEGGFELEEELGRLRDQEISLGLDYGVASVSDPSLSRLELPEVSGDLVDQE